MKNVFTYLFITIVSLFHANAQILEPVTWKFDTNHIQGNEHELIFTAEIDNNWTVYSQFTSDDGPVPTELTFEDISGAELMGKASEHGHKKEGMDKLFGVNVIKFLGDEDFVMKQKVKVSDPNKPITGYLTFMTCNDKTCLPPTDIDFSFTVKAGAGGSTGDNGMSSGETGIVAATKIAVKESVSEIKDAVSKTPEAVDDAVKEIKTTGIAVVEGLEDAGQDVKQEIQDQGQQDGMLEPVVWDVKSTKISDDEYELEFKAEISEGWSVYSYFMEFGGPVPTTLNYENQEGVEILGEPVETGHKKEGPDKLFPEVESVIKYLDDEDYVIKQRIKVTDESKPFTGYLNFMTCNDKTCLPPTDVEFSFFGTGSAVSDGDAAKMTVGSDGKVNQSRGAILETYEAPLSDCGDDGATNSSSLLWLLFAGILGGFAALLTPCVFPMIPITVSFFTKDTKRKGWVNGLIYGVSIIVIYVVLGLIITITLGPEALQALSTNWIANVIFFLIFIFFAGSFFGYYEITLPSSWSTNSDRMADKGGLLGIFFMAATLALVSFSCTGPIVGSALVAAANGGFIGPLVVMFGFSFALALPFGLFAAFPAWLNTLPRSGGWMNSVKVVLGFLEVGFAFKFLSTADLTQHWGFLRYEIFMAILILVAFAIAIYLFGYIKFPHDSPIKKLSLTRKAIGTLFAAIGIYLCFGFTINKDTGIYNSLWLTSGFSPPVMYNYLLDKGEVDPTIKAKYPSFTKCANNIDCFKDYYEGMAYAKETGKPAFLDFTGHGCQNCRRTEDNIWVNDKVRKTLNDDVVLISLYTDDREKLKSSFVSAIDGKKKRTVGNQWADFQVANFKQNSQPLYIMMTPDEQVITNPRGYEEGIKSYQEYLDCGLEFYNKSK